MAKLLDVTEAFSQSTEAVHEVNFLKFGIKIAEKLGKANQRLGFSLAFTEVAGPTGPGRA